MPTPRPHGEVEPASEPARVSSSSDGLVAAAKPLQVSPEAVASEGALVAVSELTGALEPPNTACPSGVVTTAGFEDAAWLTASVLEPVGTGAGPLAVEAGELATGALGTLATPEAGADPGGVASAGTTGAGAAAVAGAAWLTADGAGPALAPAGVGAGAPEAVRSEVGAGKPPPAVPPEPEEKEAGSPELPVGVGFKPFSWPVPPLADPEVLPPPPAPPVLGAGVTSNAMEALGPAAG